MPHKLVDLEIDEISGVDRPASRKHFLIIKREEGTMTAWEDIQKRAAESGQSVAEICQASPALYQRYLMEQSITVAGPLQPILKKELASTSSSDIFLSLVDARVRAGESRNDAMISVHKAHPGLYASHRGGH